ncbi:enoyl-CoA hydratase/isomerase family protein [Planctobacterium marinum]|uniref:3-hydroxyisobutyryl-CoA hydrolase n=1 Tax=Planctobacterium marinum TaxID=1631968 RepID=A0AA48HY87_9ALTE|nr:enoyl-CoA hydratase [Planctobacterium marinum]
MSEAPVLFSIVKLKHGQLGHVQLNLPKALNALNLDMVRLLTEQLQQWQSDENISAVLLSGAGDKAFCAGGDVVSLYNAMKAEPGKTPESVQTFFTEEYQLDHLIHTYSKPLIVWGSGFIMGGGIGLFAGASHKVVTETSRLAMPEITIGLFPDVGGSYFLNTLQDKMGLFLGLTGVQINAADAKLIGMADYALAEVTIESFVEQLADSELTDTRYAIEDLLASLSLKSAQKLPESNIAKYHTEIETLMSHASLADIINGISKWLETEDKWLNRAAKTLLNGSPVTQRLVWEQLKRGKGKALADCFRMELVMACRSASAGEFQEGVRALLIDKDGAPQWLYPAQENVPDDFIESFFAGPWTKQTHPLAKLGE